MHSRVSKIPSKVLCLIVLCSTLLNACGLHKTITSVLSNIVIIPFDEDNDGVTLSQDRCPSTAPEDIFLVDKSGCVPDDEDGDGVNLPFDQCPFTPKGEKVRESDGCMDHFYFAIVDFISFENGDIVKSIYTFGYEQTAEQTRKAVEELVPYWLPGYIGTYASASRVETHPILPGDQPPPCLGGVCDTPRPKGPDEIGDRFGVGFGNKGTAAGSSEGSGDGWGTSGSGNGEGDPGIGGDAPGGEAGAGNEGGSETGGSNNPADPGSNDGLGDGSGPQPTPVPLPTAPLPSIPVESVSTGGSAPEGDVFTEMGQVLANSGLKTPAESPYAPRLYKVAKSLQDVSGKWTEKINTPHSATIFNNLTRLANSALGQADELYVGENELEANSYLYFAAFMVETAYDLATSDLGREILTSVGPGAVVRDVYEAATGRSIFDDHELTGWERGMAIFGVATGGVGSKIFAGAKAADKVLGVGAMVKKIGKPLGQAEEAAEIAVREVRAAKELGKQNYDLARKLQAATGVDLKSTWNGVKVGFKSEQDVLVHRDMLSRWTEHFKVKSIENASDINKKFIANGNKAPYLEGSKVIEFETQASEVFVRVHGEIKTGSWVMRKQDIEGLTAAQIKDKYCIPTLPSYMSEVHVPAGTRMTNGFVAPIPEFGSGKGAVQYQIQKQLDESFYRNTVAIY